MTLNTWDIGRAMGFPTMLIYSNTNEHYARELDEVYSKKKWGSY
jgi:hypothetical protein